MIIEMFLMRAGFVCSVVDITNTSFTTSSHLILAMDDEEPTHGVLDLHSVISPSRAELGRLAQWSVSSHKYGFGVDNLRDDDEGTFWQ